MQIDCEELAVFLEEKSQRLTVDKDFVVAMDRLNQFALRMRQRERVAQVRPPHLTTSFPFHFRRPQDLANVLADSNGVISSEHMHWFFEAEGSRECAIWRVSCCLCTCRLLCWRAGTTTRPSCRR